jgi:sodium pump decarboxylase gamma subunit
VSLYWSVTFEHSKADLLGETMTWMENFTQATVIMCLGMGLVFLFVATLVVLIQISARVLSKYIEEEPVAAPNAAILVRNDGAIVAVIAVAMKQYSSGKK